MPQYLHECNIFVNVTSKIKIILGGIQTIKTNENAIKEVFLIFALQLPFNTLMSTCCSLDDIWKYAA